MRKLPVLILTALLLMSGCSNGDTSDKDLKNTYNSFVDSILDNNGAQSKDIPFTHTLTVEKDSEGKYRYEIKIDDPRVAMYNIQMMVVDKNTSGEYPFIGLASDDVFHMVPNQENKEKGFMKGIILGGTSDNAKLSLDIQVTWKDYAQVNTHTAFLHYDYDYDKVQAEKNAAASEEEETQ